MNPEVYPSTFIVDLDRCLVDSAFLQKQLEQAYAETIGKDATVLSEIGEIVSQSGGSFDMVTALNEMVTAQELARIRTKFLELTADNASVYEPGAEMFLQHLHDTSVPFFIMTYGGDEWQTWKLLTAGLAEVPHIILDAKDKGVYISDRYDVSTQTYVFDGIANHGEWRTSTVALIDDKAVSFGGLLSPRSRGLWYWPEGRELLRSQSIGQDELPASVQIVRSFDDIITSHLSEGRE